MTSMKRLDELCEVIMGQAPSGDAYNMDGNGWPLLAGAGDFGESTPKPKKYTTRASKVSKSGDIILGIRASIGQKVMSDGEYCLGRGVAALRPASSLDSRFLWHWLTYIAPQLTAKARGATFKQVNRDDIGEIQIALLPLSQQQRIAGQLDRAEELRANRREALSQLGELATSIFRVMFGDPRTNSKGWPGSTIGQIAEKITDGEHLTPRRTTDGIKLLSARNIRDGYIDFTNVDFIGVEEHDRIKRRCDPSVGDVLISCSGTIGRVASVSTLESFSLVRSVAMIRPNERLARTKFLEYYLRTSALKARMLQRANASSQANLFQNQIRELPFLVPPMQLQDEFVRRIEAVEKLKVSHSDHLTELNALFASLQYRAFRGEL